LDPARDINCPAGKQMTLASGTSIEWTKGAVGLADTVISVLPIPGGEPERFEVHRIETPIRTVHEFERRNLAATDKTIFSFNLALER
jgi:hypothetical protein